MRPVENRPWRGAPPPARMDAMAITTDSRALRVVIADDAVLLREGAALLLREAGFDVVAQAGDADELVRKVRGHKPDVAGGGVRGPPPGGGAGGGGGPA